MEKERDLYCVAGLISGGRLWGGRGGVVGDATAGVTGGGRSCWIPKGPGGESAAGERGIVGAGGGCGSVPLDPVWKVSPTLPDD